MFGFFKKVLGKTTESIKEIAPKKSKKVSKELLEEILLESDISYDLVEEIIYYMPPSNMVERKDVRRVLLAYFIDVEQEKEIEVKPFVDLIFGINGAGKTTTIAKLAYFYSVTKKQSVILAASDTFRAAAIEQLKRWADIIKVQIVATQQGHDPSAVAFDAISSAKAKGIDRVIIDTAGRLHTQKNLASELQKIERISNKAMEGAPHRKILILDGTQGNAAISQAQAFNEIIGVDALIITKLDGTAKGGALFSIAKELQKPILYIGTGEKQADLLAFNKEDFVDSLLDSFFLED
ncbi:MAG TPA: signal recognition particle-docking protein FtsY [Campylobacterales bacterium]|nr:signal recognition particle-docking protein FtsY [Campylobacterales bacterium]